MSRLPSSCNLILVRTHPFFRFSLPNTYTSKGPIGESSTKSEEAKPTLSSISTPYNTLLAQDSTFSNPHSLEAMAHHFHIDDTEVVSYFGASGSDYDYERLREMQNECWAKETVVKGSHKKKKKKKKHNLQILKGNRNWVCQARRLQKGDAVLPTGS